MRGFKFSYHFIILWPLLLLVCVPALAYVVRPGDTFSKIVGVHLPGPTFGRKGNLNRIRKLNPQVKNIDLIFPGMKINLGELASEQSPLRPAEAPAEQERVLASDKTLAPPVPSPFSLEFNPYFSMLELKLKDRDSGAEATLASQSNFGSNFSYRMDWSERLQSFVKLNLGYITFEQPSSGLVTTKRANKFLSGIGLGANYKLAPKLAGSFSVDYQKELFGRSLSANSITVDSVAVPSFSGRLSYDLGQRATHRFGLYGNYQYKLATSADDYKIHAGHNYGGGFYFNQQEWIQTEIGFFRREQNMNLSLQSETGVVLGMRFMMPLEKNSHD